MSFSISPGAATAAFLIVVGCAAGPAPGLVAGSDASGLTSAENNTVAASGAFYTEDQARRGQRAFRRICAECHYTSEFRGPVFVDAWRRKTARDLYREIRRTMPDDRPGSLAPQLYADVIAYMLELNGYAAGRTELPPDEEALRSLSLAPPGGGGG